MKKLFFTLVFLLMQFSCQRGQISDESSKTVNPSTQIVSVKTNSEIPNKTTENELQNNEEIYPGVTIDQEFPIIEVHDFMEEDFKDKTYSVSADEFEVTVEKFAPKNISKTGRTIFDFTTLHPDDYNSNIIGISHLLGKQSKEIYVVATGPGGVCCTNYWITDVSGKTPRNIFRSEDFGYFRDPMEVFDADGDGIYELMQWDSAFRYFMDDCGACSPEPRAVFKYGKELGKYLPAKNIQQDFVKESFLKTEKNLEETFEILKTNESVEQSLDFYHKSLSYIVDLFYLGDERKAWQKFDKYSQHFKEKEKIRAEIKKRLKQSKFYQALRKMD